MKQVKDPVCGMMVDSETAQHKSDHVGQTFYFCSPGCKKAFDQDPMKYMPKEQGGHDTQHA